VVFPSGEFADDPVRVVSRAVVYDYDVASQEAVSGVAVTKVRKRSLDAGESVQDGIPGIMRGNDNRQAVHCFVTPQAPTSAPLPRTPE
jgi:hypothetical protein